MSNPGQPDDPRALFPGHLRTLQTRLEATLGALRDEKVLIDAVLLHSGPVRTYFADDNDIPFRAYAHFAHWLPLDLPEQMLLLRPDEKPVFFRVQRETFWSDTSIPLEPWWADAFEVIDLATPETVIDHLPATRRIAFLGEDTAFAARAGFPSALHNERHLRNRMDYYRSLKTPYEVACTRRASEIAVAAHEAAHRGFLAGWSEWEIHQLYLGACDVPETDLPYGTIVAYGEKGAVLHYTRKRRDPGGNYPSFMIDAGARHLGYAADITRTYARENAPALFHELLAAVDDMKNDFVSRCRAGVTFKELNEEAHVRVLDIALELELVRGDRDALLEAKVSKTFFPHGLGHNLGLQVHDVSGLFKDKTGILEPPPEEHKALRLTRTLEPGMILTVEPGIYAMPLLVDKQRNGEHAAMFNFDHIETLIPCGGARQEDNILVTDGDPVNLTAETGG